MTIGITFGMENSILYFVTIAVAIMTIIIIINYKLYQYFAKKNIDLLEVIETQKDTIANLTIENKNFADKIDNLKKQLDSAKKIDIKFYLFDEIKMLVEQNTELMNNNKNLNAMIAHLIAQNKKLVEQTAHLEGTNMLNLFNDIKNTQEYTTAKITMRRIDTNKKVL